MSHPLAPPPPPPPPSSVKLSFNCSKSNKVNIDTLLIEETNPEFEMERKKKKNSAQHGKEDPLSHRIIEKRRRDRMNNCLAELSRLIPSTYLKKGRGRVEKTEIIEMAIKHINHLQTNANRSGIDSTTPDFVGPGPPVTSDLRETFRMGYQECLCEMVHALVEKIGVYSGDVVCVRLVNYLQNHLDELCKGKTLLSQVSPLAPPFAPKPQLPYSSSSSSNSSSSSSGYHTVSPMNNYTKNFALNQTEMQADRRLWTGEDSSERSQRSIEDLENEDLDQPENLSDRKNLSEDFSDMDKCVEDLQGSTYKFKADLSDRFSSTQRQRQTKLQQPKLLHEEETFRKRHDDNDNSERTSERTVERTLERTSDDKISMKRKRVKSSEQQDANHEESEQEQKKEKWNQDMFSTESSFHQRQTIRPRQMSDLLESRHKDDTPISEFPRQILNGETPPMERSHSIIPPPPVGSTPVPIFALHPRGSYYIPFSVDSSLLSPLYQSVEQVHEDQDQDIMLHPVTINVNFCGMPIIKAKNRRKEDEEEEDQEEKEEEEEMEKQSLPANHWRDRLNRILNPDFGQHMEEQK